LNIRKSRIVHRMISGAGHVGLTAIN